VILFDFPAEPSEYLRRVGRTGRAGNKGKATILGGSFSFVDRIAKSTMSLCGAWWAVYGRQVPVARAVVQASIDGKKIEPSNEL